MFVALAKAFRTTPQFWLNSQMNDDLARSQPKLHVEWLIAAVR
jgi:plasmid maintenance system antidote protein VapI